MRPADFSLVLCIALAGCGDDGDRFVDLLGTGSLAAREGVRDADHTIQEWTPHRVTQALRNLVGAA